tara:strand:+ start:281 stop:958 length:678 start_codon:yes stop_codon:yes gene_type:complete
MALSGSALSDLTFTGYVALIPTAATATRNNSATGVSAHNPAQKLIEGLANGLADTISILAWNGSLTGTAMPGGVGTPVAFTFPGAATAAASFLTSVGWTGASATLFAEAVITDMLNNAATLGLLYGSTGLAVGTGTALFNSALNPSVYATAQASLITTITAALKATNVFGQGDVPGDPVNADLSATIASYAAAYAEGLATMMATMIYTGSASSSAATEVVTGTIQ